MNMDEFKTIFDNQISICSNMLINKNTQYASTYDCLHNFDTAAALTGSSPARALGGMMVKHTVSIYDMIGVDNPTNFSMEVWDEKITDHLNYLILLKALVVDAYDKANSEDPDFALMNSPVGHKYDRRNVNNR